MRHDNDNTKECDNQTKQAPSEEVTKKTLSEEVMKQTPSEEITKKTSSKETTNQAPSEEVTNQTDDQINETHTLPQPVIDKVFSTNKLSSSESLSSLSDSPHLDYSFLKLSPSLDSSSLKQVPQEQVHLDSSSLDSTPVLDNPPSSPSRVLYDNSYVDTSLPKPISLDMSSGLNQHPTSTSPSSSSKVSSLNDISSISSPLPLNNSSVSNWPVPAQNSVPIAVARTTPPRLEAVPTPTSTSNTGENRTYSAQAQANALNVQHYTLFRDIGVFYCMQEAFHRRVSHIDCFAGFCNYSFYTQQSSLETKRDWSRIQENQERLCEVYNNILEAQQKGTLSNSQRKF